VPDGKNSEIGRVGVKSRAVRCVVLLVVTGCWFLLSSLVQAAGNAQPQTVEVIAAGDGPTTSALETGIRESLAQRSIELRWSLAESIRARDVLQQHAAAAPLLARIWLDARAADRAMLYVVNTSSDRFLLRVVPLEAGYDEVARESLGNIVESAIDALLAGGQIGVSREQAEAQVVREIGPLEPAAPPPPKDEPATPAADPAPLLDMFAVSYRAETLHGVAAFRHGPELSAAFGGNGAAQPALFTFLSAGYRLPSTWSAEPLAARLDGAGFRALFGLRGASGALVLRAALGVGIEALRVEAQTSSAFAAREAQWLAAPIVAALSGAELHLSGSYSLFFAASAEFDAAGNHFDVVDDQAITHSLTPWRLRPLALLGIAFTPQRER
jgi:hypothetical protein